MALPELSKEQILGWVDAHHKRTGIWPKKESGPVADAPGETWQALDDTLKRGARGLSGGSSLAKLLAEERGIRNVRDLEPLAIEKILAWADQHHARTGKWPIKTSGSIYGALHETWNKIDAAMRIGLRGLPGRSSIAQLLAEERGVPNRLSLPPLNQDQILAWADSHFQRTGEWPKQKTGSVSEAPGEKWQNIDTTLWFGRRGFPGGSSLAQLLAENHDVRNQSELSPLNTDQIFAWADAHKARTGKWPKRTSGAVDSESDETWGRVYQALINGHRSLPGGSSLTELLGQQRGVRNHLNLPPLTLEQILAWALAHKAAAGDWPSHNTGQVTGTDESWKAINQALGAGRRGLPSGSSLKKLFDQHGVRTTD